MKRFLLPRLVFLELGRRHSTAKIVARKTWSLVVLVPKEHAPEPHSGNTMVICHAWVEKLHTQGQTLTCLILSFGVYVYVL